MLSFCATEIATVSDQYANELADLGGYVSQVQYAWDVTVCDTYD